MKELKISSNKIFQSSSKNFIVVGLCNKSQALTGVVLDCAETICNAVVFNLRDEYYEYLNEIKHVGGIIYIDLARIDEEKLTLKRIKDICNYVENEFGKFVVFIDYDNLNYSAKELKKLKQLGSEMNINIVVFVDLDLDLILDLQVLTDASSALSDFNNKTLIDIADIVIVGDDQQSALLKSKSGKTGILIKEENN